MRSRSAADVRQVEYAGRMIAGDNEGLVEGALVEVGLFTGSWRFGDATGVIVLEKQ